MKGVTRFIILRVLLIALIQFACVGLWCLIFIISSRDDSTNFFFLLIRFGLLVGIVALEFVLSVHFLVDNKDCSKYFYGEKIGKKEVYSIVNRTYGKAKPAIVIIHLIAIVLLYFSCGIVKSSNGYIWTLVYGFSIGVYKTICIVIGTLCFIFSMVQYCRAIIDVKLTICSNCGRVTWYYAKKTATLVESWKETVYTTSSYTATEKIGELRDSSGNSCDVYGEVKHYDDDSYDIYHPGLHEYEYQCYFCGDKYKGIREE